MINLSNIGESEARKLLSEALTEGHFLAARARHFAKEFNAGLCSRASLDLAEGRLAANWERIESLQRALKRFGGA